MRALKSQLGSVCGTIDQQPSECTIPVPFSRTSSCITRKRLLPGVDELEGVPDDPVAVLEEIQAQALRPAQVAQRVNRPGEVGQACNVARSTVARDERQELHDPLEPPVARVEAGQVQAIVPVGDDGFLPARLFVLGQVQGSAGKGGNGNRSDIGADRWNRLSDVVRALDLQPPRLEPLGGPVQEVEDLAPADIAPLVRRREEQGPVRVEGPPALPAARHFGELRAVSQRLFRDFRETSRPAQPRLGEILTAG